MDFWCQKGIDGFRMDVISFISKVQELPDGIIQEGNIYGEFGPYSSHGPRVHEFLQEMNQKVLSRYDLLTVGETPGVTARDAEKYANLDGSELSMVFQFQHVDLGITNNKWNKEPIDLVEFKTIMSRWQKDLYGKAWNSLYLSNHDQPRCVSRFGNDDPKWRVLSAKMLGTCIHMMQGTPYVYQGEELGMTNYPFTKIEQFRDIEALNAYKELVLEGDRDSEDLISAMQYKGRDNARTPMQWNDSENAGFTTGEPWIDVNPNYVEVNAEAALKDPDSVFYYYKKLISLRKEYDVITDGKYELLMPESKTVYAYTRDDGKHKLFVLCNFSDSNQQISQECCGYDGEVLISNYNRKEFVAGEQLKPYEAIVLLCR